MDGFRSSLRFASINKISKVKIILGTNASFTLKPSYQCESFFITLGIKTG